MTSRKTLIREQDRHKQAFEAYYAQSGQRSYRKLAEQIGVSQSTIKLWARSFGWAQRIRERDANVARQTADRVVGSAVEDASRKRKMVELALLKVIKAINNGNVKIQVGDLDRLLRLQAFLDGDRIPLNGEALQAYPIEQVAQATWDWFFSLNDEGRTVALATMRRNGAPEIRPAAPPSTVPPPTPEEGQFSGSDGSERDSPQNDPSGRL